VNKRVEFSTPGHAGVAELGWCADRTAPAHAHGSALHTTLLSTKRARLCGTGLQSSLGGAAFPRDAVCASLGRQVPLAGPDGSWYHLEPFQVATALRL
jgi:hypothetical protein